MTGYRLSVLTSLLLFLLTGCGSGCGYGKQPYTDTAPHDTGFVTTASGVRLHYLDFHGTGDHMVFLAGLGNSAHIYDDFAPRFTDRYRVIALTRRGFGESDQPPRAMTLLRCQPISWSVLIHSKSAEPSSWGTLSLELR